METKSIKRSSAGAMFAWAIIFALLGLALMFISLFIPPQGEIHSSVLIGAGEVFVFSGTMLGLKGGLKQIQEFLNMYKDIKNSK